MAAMDNDEKGLLRLNKGQCVNDYERGDVINNNFLGFSIDHDANEHND
jgi:hypothetical protein